MMQYNERDGKSGNATNAIKTQNNKRNVTTAHKRKQQRQ